jgi:hypothetical protein
LVNRSHGAAADEVSIYATLDVLGRGIRWHIYVGVIEAFMERNR